MSQAEREKCGMNGRKAPKTRGYAADNPYEVIHILSDINRMQILRLLAEHGELCARDILSYFPITQPTLSHHMNVLLDNHLVEARKSGRWVFYHLSQSGIQEIINFFENLKKSSSDSAANLQKNISLPVKSRTRITGTRFIPESAPSAKRVSPAENPAARSAKSVPQAKPFAPEKPAVSKKTAACADKKEIPAAESAVTEVNTTIPEVMKEAPSVAAAGSPEKYTEILTSKKDKKKDKDKDKDKDKLSKKEKKEKKEKDKKKNKKK